MSSNLGKRIKIMAVLTGVAGFLASAAMAVNCFMQNILFTACLWAVFGILSLFLIVPLFMIGNLSDELWEQKRKLRGLNEKTVKIEKNGKTTTSIDKYSPIKTDTSTGTRNQTPSLSITAQTRVKPAEEAPANRVPTAATPAVKPEAAETATRVFNKTDEARIDTENLITDTQIDVPTVRKPEEKPVVEQKREERPVPTATEAFVAERRNKAAVIAVPKVRPTTIAAGGEHTVAITEYGGAIAVGNNLFDQCNVVDWNDITSVAAGTFHTIGLRANGTCIATGYSSCGQCNVGDWKNVCAIAAGGEHTVGLLENGTCVAVGDNTYGQCDVSDWREIIAISAGNQYTVGLCSDGTIVAVGAGTDGQWGANRWSGIKAIAAAGTHTIGLYNDGTCVACGNNSNSQCSVLSWKNVRAIAVGAYHTVGLLSNGCVVATGMNGDGQCNVQDWNGVVAIAAGKKHTLGLTESGILLSTGDNRKGQCDTKLFENLKIVRNR